MSSLADSNNNKQWAKLAATMQAIMRLDSPETDPEAAKAKAQGAFSKTRADTATVNIFLLSG